jgi:hypothetical protein
VKEGPLTFSGDIVGDTKEYIECKSESNNRNVPVPFNKAHEKGDSQ